MKKLVCAPMATLSHEAFRRCIERFFGADEYFTEMIHAPSLLNGGPFERFYLQNGPVPEKIVWQLTGPEPTSLAKAAIIVAKRGGIGVDLNMGCSAPAIYKTGAGIAWMLKPLEETRSAVQAVRNALNAFEKDCGRHIRLSVKCRLGAEDFTDERFFAFTDMLVKEGVELITLHPRTIKEKYRRAPRWQYAQTLSFRYSIPIYLNGCIDGAHSVEEATLLAPNVAGFMIARAAVKKPWIFALLRGELKEKIDAQSLALDFIDDVVKFQPAEFVRTRLSRFFSYYCQNFSFAHYFAMRMQNVLTAEDSKAEVIDYFKKVPSDRYICEDGIGDVI